MTYKFFIATKVVLSDNLLTISGRQLYNTYDKKELYMVKKAIILCGGNGTRFLPVTKVFPKEMLPIINRPAIEFHLNECKEAGIKDILIIINKRKDMMKAYFEKDEFFDKLIGKTGFEDMNISFEYQGEKKGTGGALLVAKEWAKGDDVAILYGDDHFIGSATKELVGVFDKYKTDIVGVKRCNTDDIVNYGVMVGTEVEDGVMECTAVKEKPSLDDVPSRYYAVGRYICKGDIFDRLETLNPHSNGECYLADAFDGFVSAYINCERFDLGSKPGFVKAMIYHGLNSEWADEIREYIKELL